MKTANGSEDEGEAEQREYSGYGESHPYPFYWVEFGGESVPARLIGQHVCGSRKWLIPGIARVVYEEGQTPEDSIPGAEITSVGRFVFPELNEKSFMLTGNLPERMNGYGYLIVEPRFLIADNMFGPWFPHPINATCQSGFFVRAWHRFKKRLRIGA